MCRPFRPIDPCPVCGDDPWGRYHAGGAGLAALSALCGCRRAEREIEKATGKHRLEVEEIDFEDGDGLEMFYSHLRSFAGAAIKTSLSDVEWRAREVEANGYHIYTPKFVRDWAPKNSCGGWQIFSFTATTPELVSETVISAINIAMPAMEPGWIEDVREARRYADSERVICAWTGLPMQVVVSALAMLEMP